MCLILYDYQSKASIYRKGLTYLNNVVTTNKKHTIDSQKPKKTEHKCNTKGNHQTIKGKTKKIKTKGTKKIYKLNWKTRFKIAINIYQ